MADSAARAGFTLVTPASRGLGFAFAKQLLSRTDLPVVATARNDCPALRQRLLDGATESRDADKRLTVLEVDVTRTFILKVSLNYGTDNLAQRNLLYPPWLLVSARSTLRRHFGLP